jgi:nitroimidazol reductase NimA-like FMN-containing flavoprotein (pyridoxamine 5'-phosphate oxidase superfamily)
VSAPTAEIDIRFGSPEATATPWATAEPLVEAAELWWITTVRADGRPHITPLLAVWADGALHFTTGPEEQKAVNLRGNDQVALTTGVNTQDDGLDVVIHGRAERVTDGDRLQRLADAWVAKYGEDWRFTPSDGAFTHGDEGEVVAHVFAVAPTEAFGFGKGTTFSQTRWRFASA